MRHSQLPFFLLWCTWLEFCFSLVQETKIKKLASIYLFHNWILWSLRSYKWKHQTGQITRHSPFRSQPVHVTVNARDESDLEPNEIVNKVVKAAGSQFSVLKSSPNNAPNERPVVSLLCRCTNRQHDLSCCVLDTLVSLHCLRQSLSFLWSVRCLFIFLHFTKTHRKLLLTTIIFRLLKSQR